MKWFVQASAEEDILRQFEWYAERGLPAIARRFLAATREAIDGLAAMPEAGAPRPIGNPRLAGLRSWPVKTFNEFRIYYLTQPELLTIVRVLHGRRDVGALLEDREIDDHPDAGRPGS